MTACPSPIELSRAYAVGLDPELRTHVAGCARCSDELVAHAAVADDVRRLPVHVPPPDRARDVRAGLLAAAREAGLVDVARISPLPRRRWPWLVATGALAAAAAVAILVTRPGASSSRATIHAHPGAQLARIDAELVRLADGTATFEAIEAVHVATGDGELAGRGTFDVTAEHDRLRSVRVLHGRVEVRIATQTIILVDGQHWEPQLARADVVPTKVAAAEPAPVPPVVVEPARHVAHTPAKPRAPAPAAPEIIAEPERPAAIAKRPIELLFERGWAELAANQVTTAAATFERAARAAPSDPLAEDAWFWRASALARAKSADAATALAAFLARYPSSPRGGEASAMLGWLVVDHDLARAEVLFRTAAADRVAAVRASGEKGLALVASRR